MSENHCRAPRPQVSERALACRIKDIWLARTAHRLDFRNDLSFGSVVNRRLVSCTYQRTVMPIADACSTDAASPAPELDCALGQRTLRRMWTSNIICLDYRVRFALNEASDQTGWQGLRGWQRRRWRANPIMCVGIAAKGNGHGYVSCRRLTIAHNPSGSEQ